jgi:hypothetical protein
MNQFFSVGFNMKYLLVLSSSLFMSFGLLLAFQPVQASEITFSPRTSLSLTSYKFTQSERVGALANTGINGNDFPEITFEVTFKILGIGGTFFKDGYYLDMFIQKSADEEDSFTLDDPIIPEPFKETFKGDRLDNTITLGKKILDNKGAVYFGYKTGKSEASGNQGQHLTFKEKGLFVGANYGWVVTKSSMFIVNIAYADLEGDLREEITNPLFDTGSGPSDIVVPLDIDASSDSKGLSYGVSWASRISNTVSYSVSIDAKKYTFDNIKDKNPATITSDKFEEKFVSAMLSLYYQF